MSSNYNICITWKTIGELHALHYIEYEKGIRGEKEAEKGAYLIFTWQWCARSGRSYWIVFDLVLPNGYPKETMGYYFYIPPENKIVVARYAEFLENNLISQEARDLNEPTNYKAALLNPESNKWLDAINAKMQSLKDNQVWRLLDLPPNTKTIANIRSIRILIAITVYYDYKIWQMEVKTAFLNGYLDEDIYMVQLKGFIINTNDIFLVYGGNPKAELRVNCYYVARFKTYTDGINSQTGYIFILNGGALDWKNSKQSTTSKSTIEAEHKMLQKLQWKLFGLGSLYLGLA
ncbi:retrotransposon protein, putative, ty1-copia subclass [Tanacetum coccineum]